MKITIKTKGVEVSLDDGIDKSITYSCHNEQVLILLREMIKQTKDLVNTV